MASKKVILCPNPFRDERLAAAKRSKEILESVGLQTVVCLPFNREGYGEELGVPIRPLQQEIKSADLLIAFGGDGTILHLARTAALHRVPVLGINLGSLGFMSELELNELDRLRDLKDWNFTVESRMMLDVSVVRGGRTVYNTIALNDAVISKGSIARVVRLNIFYRGGLPDPRRRRRGCARHAHRLHGVFHGCGRPDRRADGAEPAHHADLPALDALELLCPLARAPHHGRGDGCQPQVCLPFLRRGKGVFPQKRGSDPRLAVQAHHAAGAPVEEELLRDSR